MFTVGSHVSILKQNHSDVGRCLYIKTKKFFSPKYFYIETRMFRFSPDVLYSEVGTIIVIAIMLRYVFALLQNGLYISVENSYRFR